MNAPHGSDATFANFVEGPGSSRAAATARAVVEAPDAGARLVVLVGGPGLGKTHLLRAIRAAASTLQVELETIPGLAERAHGERGGVLPLLEGDLLLLDDLERLADRPDLTPLVQELLEGRLPGGRRVVLASEVSPAELTADASELAHLLADALVVELLPPDPGTRLAILRGRAPGLSPALPDEVLAAVAALPIASVRELLAALQRLVAFQAVSPVALDAAQARMLIRGVADPAGEAPASAESAPMAETIARPEPSLAVGDDEFGSFLTEVMASVGHQVDQWRTQLGQAILVHGGEGYRTTRLEALLTQELPAGPGEALASFARDVQRLKALESEAITLAPDLGGAPAFRDPDRLPEAEALLVQARTRRDPLPRPATGYRLERFGQGPGNRHAAQAALGVTQAPGSRYNPLLIVGASGTGKTHLMHGIGNALLERHEGAVACVGAAAFVAEAEALDPASGRAEWRARYQHASALLVDDLHLLVGHPRAQEELFLVFTHLVESGRQVVFTSAVPATMLAGIAPRLLTRLEAGLMVDLARPDRDVRLVVVKQLLAGTPAAGDAALADWLAAWPADSVRAVQGAVRRVLSAAEAQGVLPSPALAREVLETRPSPRGEPRRSGSHLGAGVTGPVHGVARSAEKMITVWPRLADRLIEDLG